MANKNPFASSFLAGSRLTLSIISETFLSDKKAAAGLIESLRRAASATEAARVNTV
jgi:hypothetical protein